MTRTAGGAMAAEIAEQPAQWRTLLADAGPELDAVAATIRRYDPHTVLLVARGTSDHAALYAKYLVEIRLGKAAGLVSPSTMTAYGARPDFRGVLMIAVSQSGGSPDLVRSLEVARDCGALTVAVTNNAASDLARAAAAHVDVLAGPERAVAATKSYTAQLLALHQLLDRVGGGHGGAAAGLPDLADALLERREEIAALASRYRFAQRMVTTGRGYSYPTAREAALKLMETAYLSAQAFSGGRPAPRAARDDRPTGAGAGRGRRRDRRPRDGPGAAAAGRAGRRRLHRRGRAGCARGAARGGAGGAVAAAGDPAVPAARAARRRRARGRPGRAARPGQGHGDAVILSADALVAPAVDGPGWLQTEGDRIVALGSGVVAADAHFPVLVPGFVDVHVHGGAGAAFPGGDVEDALRAVAFHRAHGTTTTLASLVTAAPEELRRAVDALAELVVDGEIAGVHLEGPWLAASRCGAHDPAQLRDPDPGELDELLVTGVVAMVTLAPERVGALDAVRRVVGAGATAAVGHTAADFALTRAAIAAGARHATHLFNAMAPLHHREPGPVVALLDDDRVTVELVTDGLHVHPALWEHVVRAAGAHRVAAVTDAMAAAGMPDGAYRLGRLDVEVVDRVARLAGGGGPGAIAGSTATADALFRNIVAHAAVPRTAALRRAVAMTASTPARALGLPDVGELAVGRRADLVGLSADLAVEAVYRSGERVPPWHER